MIIDAHLHCTGQETADDVMSTLDEAGVDVGVLLAPFLGHGYSLDDAASLRRANEHLSALVRRHPDRLIGFAVVDPRHPDAPNDLRHAIEDLGLRGCKMVPTGWYPHDEHVQPVFAVANEHALPLLFHSGIFIDGRSGRFCRPTYFEALRDHPRTRVALAHMGWPWTDEALAVALIDRIHGVPHAQAQFRLDISFGPPPPYRREVLARMLEVLGAGSLQFGSDCFLPCSGAQVRERMQWVVSLMDLLELNPQDRAQIWSGTAAAWLGLPASEHPSRAVPVARGLERSDLRFTSGGAVAGAGMGAGLDAGMGVGTAAGVGLKSRAGTVEPCSAAAMAGRFSSLSGMTPNSANGAEWHEGRADRWRPICC